MEDKVYLLVVAALGQTFTRQQVYVWLLNEKRYHEAKIRLVITDFVDQSLPSFKGVYEAHGSSPFYANLGPTSQPYVLLAILKLMSAFDYGTGFPKFGGY